MPNSFFFLNNSCGLMPQNTFGIAEDDGDSVTAPDIIPFVFFVQIV